MWRLRQASRWRYRVSSLSHSRPIELGQIGNRGSDTSNIGVSQRTKFTPKISECGTAIYKNAYFVRDRRNKCFSSEMLLCWWENHRNTGIDFLYGNTFRLKTHILSTLTALRTENTYILGMLYPHARQSGHARYIQHITLNKLWFCIWRRSFGVLYTCRTRSAGMLTQRYSAK